MMSCGNAYDGEWGTAANGGATATANRRDAEGAEDGSGNSLAAPAGALGRVLDHNTLSQ